MRTHPESQKFVMKYLSPKNQEKFLDFLAPKSGVNLEQAKSDLKKIRTVDENCLSENGDKSNCRFADKAQLEEKYKKVVEGGGPLGNAAKQLIQIEKAKFDQFEKIDKLTE